MNFNNVVFESSFSEYTQLPESDLPEICFSGRSNVGKSSLINKIFNRKSIARVSSKPGKTVTVNFFKVENIRLVDLPGYGYAKVSFDEKERWAELMEGYFGTERNISLVFQLIDMRHKPSEFDISMIDFLEQNGIPYVIVLTKSDKLNKTEYKQRLSAVRDEIGIVSDNTQIVPFSVLNNNGADALREIIAQISANA